MFAISLIPLLLLFTPFTTAIPHSYHYPRPATSPIPSPKRPIWCTGLPAITLHLNSDNLPLHSSNSPVTSDAPQKGSSSPFRLGITTKTYFDDRWQPQKFRFRPNNGLMQQSGLCQGELIPIGGEWNKSENAHLYLHDLGVMGTGSNDLPRYVTRIGNPFDSSMSNTPLEGLSRWTLARKEGEGERMWLGLGMQTDTKLQEVTMEWIACRVEGEVRNGAGWTEEGLEMYIGGRDTEWRSKGRCIGGLEVEVSSRE